MTAAKKPDGDVAVQEAVEGRGMRDVKRDAKSGGESGGESRGSDARGERPPTAGPHAEPDLVNPDATPGAGTLPRAGEQDVDSTSG